jgi:hypothetical protein
MTSTNFIVDRRRGKSARTTKTFPVLCLVLHGISPFAAGNKSVKTAQPNYNPRRSLTMTPYATSDS